MTSPPSRRSGKRPPSAISKPPRDCSIRQSCSTAPAAGWTRSGVLTGPDAYLGYMTDVEVQWENFDFEVERLIDAGEAIVVFLLEKGRSGRGEAELVNETAMAFKVNEGKLVEARGFLDREEAIEAARQGKLSG